MVFFLVCVVLRVLYFRKQKKWRERKAVGENGSKHGPQGRGRVAKEREVVGGEEEHIYITQRHSRVPGIRDG